MKQIKKLAPQNLASEVTGGKCEKSVKWCRLIADRESSAFFGFFGFCARLLLTTIQCFLARINSNSYLAVKIRKTTLDLFICDIGEKFNWKSVETIANPSRHVISWRR